MCEVKVAICVLNYNTYNKTKKCIDSCLLQKGANFRIFLVDNNSTDNSFCQLKKMYGDIIDYIQNADNYGYAKGNNIAVLKCKEQGYKYTFLLNSDTELCGEYLVKNMVDIFENNTQSGIIAPLVFDVTKNGHIIHTNDSSYLRLLRFFKVIPSNKQISDNILTVSEAHGSALMVSNDLFTKIGGFPEHYFMYTEECLLSKKILWSGKQIVWYKNVSEYVLHHHDKSGKVDPWRTYLMGRNRSLEYYENKEEHTPMWFWAYWIMYIKMLFSSLYSDYCKDYYLGMKSGRDIYLKDYSRSEILNMGRLIRETYKR